MLAAGGVLTILHLLPLIVIFAIVGLELSIAFLQAYVFTNDLDEKFPTIKFRFDHEPFDISNIKWDFVREITV